MKYIILALVTLLFFSSAVYCQNNSKATRRIEKRSQVEQAGIVAKSDTGLPPFNTDSLIKIKLVKLALNAPGMEIASANVRIAKAELPLAKASWLGSINAGGNVNEFVINNSPAANFFPKYNLGLSLPFDILTKSGRDKKVARENIIISNELKKDKEQMLKTQVLIAYENYKEKNEIAILQKSNIEYEFSAYQAAQKSYTDGDMILEDMNKTYQLYLSERATQVSKERDLNIAVIQLEQLVGVPLSEALKL